MNARESSAVLIRSITFENRWLKRHEEREVVLVERPARGLVVRVDDADHGRTDLERNAHERFRLVLRIVRRALEPARLDVLDEERLARFRDLSRDAGAEARSRMRDDALVEPVGDLDEELLLLLVEEHEGDDLRREHLGDDRHGELEHLLDLVAGVDRIEEVAEEIVEVVLLRAA